MPTAKKSPEAFRTISEVADILDIPAHVLRFWESRFSQIKPVKRGGGRRYYRPQDIDLLRGIRDLLYSDGLTIKGVQKLLRTQGVKHVAGLGHLAPEADPVVTGAVQPPTSDAPKPKRTKPAPAKPAPKEAAAEPAPPLIEIKPTQPQPTQIDLFAQDTARERPAFPPDPATSARRDQLRTILGKLETLRAKMAQGLE